MKHYNDISSFNKDIGIEAPEHPLFSVTIGHKKNETMDDIVFSTGFYIISFR